MAEEEDENDYKQKGTLDIRAPYQLRYWAEELNVSRETLKRAWYEVGPDIKKIKGFLKKQ